MTEKSPFESMTPESIKSEMLGRVINARRRCGCP